MKVAAVWSRLLQFRSGPKKERFFACEPHRPKLEAGDVSSFMPARGFPACEPVALTDDPEHYCDFCKEG